MLESFIPDIRGDFAQKVPKNRTKRGQTGLIFACTNIFMRGKNHVLQPRPSDKNWPSYGDFVIFWDIIGHH